MVVPGCARLIDGEGETSDGVRPNVAPSSLEIVGSGDDEIDTLSRNALADLETYWEETFPEVYGTEFEPVAGGTRVTETWDASRVPAPVWIGLKLAGFPAKSRRGIDGTLVKLAHAAEADEKNARAQDGTA